MISMLTENSRNSLAATVCTYKMFVSEIGSCYVNDVVVVVVVVKALQIQVRIVHQHIGFY